MVPSSGASNNSEIEFEPYDSAAINLPSVSGAISHSKNNGPGLQNVIALMLLQNKEPLSHDPRYYRLIDTSYNMLIKGGEAASLLLVESKSQTTHSSVETPPFGDDQSQLVTDRLVFDNSYHITNENLSPETKRTELRWKRAATAITRSTIIRALLEPTSPPRPQIFKLQNALVANIFDTAIPRLFQGLWEPDAIHTFIA